jgi:hypothetical protein
VLRGWYSPEGTSTVAPLENKQNCSCLLLLGKATLVVDLDKRADFALSDPSFVLLVGETLQYRAAKHLTISSDILFGDW